MSDGRQVGSDNPMPIRGSVAPAVLSATILSVQTAAPGSDYAAFGSQACTVLDIINTSGADVEYRRNGAGAALTIPTGGGRLVTGISNASEVSLRRVDLSNTQVTVKAEALS